MRPSPSPLSSSSLSSRALLSRALLCSLLAIAALAACGGCGDNNKAAPPDAPPADAPAVDAPDNRRGPATINLTASANSLTWDAAANKLLLTDNTTNSLVTWSDAEGQKSVGPFPPQTAGSSLGDLVKRSDGRILTANFGFGTQGSILAINAAGQASTLTGLVTNRRRIGLAQDSAGALYVSYFTGGGGMQQTGGVAKVEITGDAATETEIAGSSTNSGLRKVVGLVATPSAVFVVDQTQKKLFKIAIPGHEVTEVATMSNGDLLTMLPNGDLLTGGGGEVLRITQSGTVTTLFSGFEQVRGLAYDPALKRLFIIDHSQTAGTPDKLQIRPLDG